MNLDFMKGYTKGEKIGGLIVFALVAIGILFLYASIGGVFGIENDLTKAARTATAFDMIVGTILVAVAIAWVIAFATDWIPFRISLMFCFIITAVLIVLSLLAFCGWFAGVY